MRNESQLHALPAFVALEAALQNIEAAQSLVISSRDELAQALMTLAIQTEQDEVLQKQVLCYLYWEREDLLTTTIAEAFGINVYTLRQIAEKAGYTYACPQCHEPYNITSRTQLNAIRTEIHKRQQGESRGSSISFLCRKCETDNSDTYWQEYKQRQVDQARRVQQLHTMPYSEYLRSPEWQSTRLAHLKRAHYRCQVCNAGNTELNVHHRTYERRGAELARDLLVLCRHCHDIFHREGRLAQEQ